MNGGQQHDDECQPATSRPGEMYTVEGQIKAYGAFARGLRNRNPRAREYQRSMARTAGAVLAIGVAVVAVVAVIAVVSAVL